MPDRHDAGEPECRGLWAGAAPHRLPTIGRKPGQEGEKEGGGGKVAVGSSSIFWIAEEIDNGKVCKRTDSITVYWIQLRIYARDDNENKTKQGKTKQNKTKPTNQNRKTGVT